jgi:hypothetical protein
MVEYYETNKKIPQGLHGRSRNRGKKNKSPKHAKIMFLGSTPVATFLFGKMSLNT